MECKIPGERFVKRTRFLFKVLSVLSYSQPCKTLGLLVKIYVAGPRDSTYLDDYV
jgi:hypothetical protein